MSSQVSTRSISKQDISPCASTVANAMNDSVGEQLEAREWKDESGENFVSGRPKHIGAQQTRNMHSGVQTNRPVDFVYSSRSTKQLDSYRSGQRQVYAVCS